MPKTYSILRGAVFAPLVLGGMGLSASTPDALPPATLNAIRSQEESRKSQALDETMQQRSRLGLDGGHGFQATQTFTNPLGQTQIHLQQNYQGVKVLGGEVLVRFNAAGYCDRTVDRTVKTGFQGLSTSPVLSPEKALTLAQRELGSNTPLAFPAKVELVLFRDDGRRSKSRSGVMMSGSPALRLAYQVHTAVEAPSEIRSTDFLVDALDGRILKQWDSLQTASSTVQGKGFYTQNVQLNVETAEDGTQLLRDTTRGQNPHPIYSFSGKGNLFLNMQHSANTYPFTWGEIYSNAPGATWGDGTLYADDPGRDGSNTPGGQSVTVDVFEGTAKTWDFNSQVLGWKGIDNRDSASFTRVHLGHVFANAFWSDDCFCMSYGDGNPRFMAPPVTVDIAAHEINHGVTAAMGGLMYSGESGGLNESMSDVFSKMVEVWAKSPGGLGATVPEMGSGLNWGLGVVLINPQAPADPSQWFPLRYMDHPSLDGLSADAWCPGMKEEDVHYTSGPMNRAFYFLSQGAYGAPGSSGYSHFTPAGFSGIGNDKATRILFQMRQTLPPMATYADARQEAIAAAQSLYGDSAIAAVRNAFAAINVGLGSTSLQITRSQAAWGDPSIGGMVPVGGSVTYESQFAGLTWSLLEGPVAGSIAPDATDATKAVFMAGNQPGVYHIQAQGSVGSAIFAVTVIQPDLNQDGREDAWDLGVLSFAEGARPTASSDLNGDGVVNGFDMHMLENQLQQIR